VHLQSPKSTIGGVCPQLPNWDAISRELSQEMGTYRIFSSPPGVRHILYFMSTSGGIDPCLYHAFCASSHKITVAR